MRICSMLFGLRHRVHIVDFIAQRAYLSKLHVAAQHTELGCPRGIRFRPPCCPVSCFGRVCCCWGEISVSSSFLWSLSPSVRVFFFFFRFFFVCRRQDTQHTMVVEGGVCHSDANGVSMISSAMFYLNRTVQHRPIASVHLSSIMCLPLPYAVFLPPHRCLAVGVSPRKPSACINVYGLIRSPRAGKYSTRSGRHASACASIATIYCDLLKPT